MPVPSADPSLVTIPLDVYPAVVGFADYRLARKATDEICAEGVIARRHVAASSRAPLETTAEIGYESAPV